MLSGFKRQTSDPAHLADPQPWLKARAAEAKDAGYPWARGAERKDPPALLLEAWATQPPHTKPAFDP